MCLLELVHPLRSSYLRPSPARVRGAARDQSIGAATDPPAAGHFFVVLLAATRWCAAMLAMVWSPSMARSPPTRYGVARVALAAIDNARGILFIVSRAARR